MNIIFLIILFIASLGILNTVDRWSTRTLFKYNHAVATNQELREKLSERNRTDDFRNEMNPFARKFMRKFGINKGMTIFSWIFIAPLILVMSAFIFYDYVHPFISIAYPSFYLGAIYVQLMRAYHAEKIAKEYGVELE